MAKKRYADSELTGSAPQPSFLGNLGSGVLSGISTVANVLDTPGSMVRDTLGGKNPFDQLLAPHRSDNRLTGRDLLRQYGLVGKKDTWGNFAGGMAAEIALDPLTYIGVGGLTRAGKVAKSAGLLDDVTRVATASGRKAGRLGFGETAGKLSGRARTTLGDVVNYGVDAGERLQKATHASQKAGMDLDSLMNQPLGGIANIGIPGFPKINIGASEAGAKFAEGVGKAVKMIPGADLVSQGLGHANRVRKGFFHAAAGGFFDKYGQEIAGHAYDKLPAAKKTMLRQVLALKDRFDDLHKQFKEVFNPAAVPGSLSGTSKFNPGDWVQTADRGNYGQVVQSGKDTAQVHFTHPQTGATATVEMPHTNLTKKELPAGQSNLHDPTTRVLDRIVKMTAETKGDIDAAVTKFGQNQPITPELKGHIKQLAEDYVTAKDSIWQMNLEMGGKGRVLSELDDFQHFPRYAAERGGEMPEKWKVLPMGHPSTAAREGALRYLRQDEINDLLKNPKYRGKDLGAVSAEIMNDYGDRLGYEGADGVVDTVGHAEELAQWINQHSGSWVKKQKDLFDNLSIHDLGKYLLAAHKRNASLDAIHHAFVMNLTEGGIPVADAFKAVGMDADNALEYFSKVGGINLGGGVPPELVNAAKSVFKTYEVPEWQNAITKTLDWANGWFKPSVTMVKPAFWVRNHTSGQYANLVSGYMETPADLMQYMESYKQAMDLWKKNDPAFMRELQVEGIMGLDSTWDATKEGLFSAGMPGQSPYPDNPLKFKQTFQEVGQKMAEQPTPEHPALKFIAEKTAKPRQAVASYMASNSKANRAVEYANRSAMYIYLKGKGYDPTQAAKIVESIHFNYSGGALSPFENTVMKRIIPFYVFSRNSLPWAIERLIEKPSGGLGQTLRALNRSHKQEDMAPEYIGETASVPLGDLPDGSRRYLTGVGLNFEDPAQFATPSLKSAGLEVLSRMNPILKAPLEYATGQSFFQKGPKGGRDIEDLDPLLGRTLSNIGELTGLKKSKEPVRYPGSGVLEHMISNSPLTGFGTAVRTLTDPRKSPIDKFFNLGTGLRLTDVSPASQDKELRSRINRAEKQLGAKTYIDTYVPKETKAQMSPQELQAYMQIQALRQLLEERSKERKKK